MGKNLYANMAGFYIVMHTGISIIINYYIG